MRKGIIGIMLSVVMIINAAPLSFAEGGDGVPYNAAPEAPTGLLTNELENPLNVENPTFGWIVNDNDKNSAQSAYRIVVTDEITGNVAWDSGKVESSEQSYVPFEAGQGSNGNGGYKANFNSYGGASKRVIGPVGIYRNEPIGASIMIKAAYDGEGKLVTVLSAAVASGDADTLATAFSGSLDDPNISVTIPEGGSVKVFLWEGESIGAALKPAAMPLEITTDGTDFTDNLDEINFAALEAGHPYSWTVQTWDQADEVSLMSEKAYFTTGLNEEEWAKAQWISDGTTGAEKAEGTYNHYWYVRTNKTLTKTVKAATAYFSGVHDYDLYVNGTEIGRGQSFDYSSEARYQGWDITEAVKSNTGSVSIGALVRTYGGGQGRAPGNAAFIGYVKLYYEDGTSDIIATNTTDWKISKTTPYKEINSSRASGTRNGEGDFAEEYTAQNAQNFTSPSFDASSWTEASARVGGTKATYKGTEIDDGIITDTPIAELSKVTDYLVKPVSVTKLSDGTTVADFGVVIPARPVITFANGTANNSITITGGYFLGSDGKVATGDKPQQSTNMTWTYKQTAGAQTYRAWDHLGFRYLQIPSCGETFTTDTIQAAVVHTNVPEGRQSTLVTSNETLNNVYTLMQRSSLYGIQNEFVDTPTREKGQFTDDARNISEASMSTQFEREATRKAIMQFLASADRFWTDSEGNLTGRVNSVYPNVEGGRDIPEYSVNIPQWVWNYYMQTGDKATLKYAYPYMKATADYLTKYTSSTTGLVEKLAGGDTNPNDYQYGIVDWPASGRFGYDWKNSQKGAFTTVNMLSKHAYDVVALAAAELDEEADKTDMESRSAALKTAINSKLFNTSKGLYCDGTTNTSGSQSSHISQHANSYALAFDIVEEANKDAVAGYVASQGMKQGPMTADILAKGLFNGGQNAAALKLFVNENDYGWANIIKRGGSFTWESWVADGTTVSDSQSHAWGATAASDMLRNFAGVQILEAGAKKVKIAPVYVDLTSLDAIVQTERGGVGVKYERDDTKYEITITIPANMTAEVKLPNIGEGTYRAESKTGAAVANSFTLGSGTYKYVFDGEIIPPETLDTKVYDEEAYNFKTLPATASGDYAYNDYITLYFGANGKASADDGFNLYKDSVDNAYLIFTPVADGTVELTGKVRGNASTLYVSEDVTAALAASTAGATELRSAGKDSATTDIGSMTVEAGHTYYFYNTGGTSSANPTSITTLTYKHEHVPLLGIKGTLGADNKTYTYTIGDSEDGASVYTDTSEYVDLAVGLGNGDSMNETIGTITFSKTPVPDSGSVNDTGRYIIVEPKYNGVFAINITATGTQNNRVYYYDFGSENVDLTKCTKDGGTVAKQLSANTAADVAIEMKAGRKYVVYPYTQKGSCTISAMSYVMTSAASEEREQLDIPERTAESAPIELSTTTTITLDHDTYPLVVGNSSSTDFAKWEDQGSSIKLTAATTSGNASDITWQVEDEDIAYITDSTEKGASKTIRGKRTGVTKVVASLGEDNNTACYITVIDNVTRITAETLKLNTDELELTTGSTAELIPIINPKDVFDNGMLDNGVSYRSFDETVATVDSHGVVTAVGEGTTYIGAMTYDVGRVAYCDVTVTNGTAKEATVGVPNAVKNITVGDEPTPITAEGTDLTWRSDNPAVADVDSTGKVTGYSNSNKPKIGSNGQTVFENGITLYDEGTVNIYATSKDGSVQVFPVRVGDAERKATDISIYMEDTNVVVGTPAEITAAVLPAYAFSKDVTWKSMDETVATVTSSGRTVYGVPKATITGLKAGTVMIRATCDGQVTSQKITVTETVPQTTVTAASDVSLTIDADEVYAKKLFNISRPHSAYTYLSTDNEIVTVNNEAVIKGYKEGTATIYAIANDSVDTAEQETLDMLLETRTIGADNAELAALISGVTYAKHDINVVDYTPSLRNLHAPAEARTDTSVNLLWNRASLLDTGDFVSYNVYKSTDGFDYGSPIATGITTLGYTAEGLEPETTYYFKVEAVDSEGNPLAEKTVAAKTKAASTIINVMDKGALGDGVHMDTYAIQKAIDEADYGDTILLPEGKIFLSGALYLKSDITFKVDGILLGSPYDKDYPATITRWEGWRRLYQTAEEWGANSGTDGLTENVHPHASLINAGTYDEGTASYTGAYNVENLTICGKGMINANGFRLGYNEGLNHKETQPTPMTPAMNQTVRGRAITLHNADKVYIKDVTVAYSPSWTIHPIFCRNLTVDGVSVVSAGDGKTGAADDITILNGDGIDPDSSTMVNLFNMNFQTGDDGIAIKTGKDKEGNLLDKPCAYIRVTDCYSHDSKGGIVIGSENASGTHDALIQNIKVGSTTLKHTIWLKGCWSRGGVTHDLLIRDIDGVDKFDIQTTYNTPTNNPADSVPVYKYITFENCNVSFTAKGFNHSISGLSALGKTRPETYLESFTIRGCNKGGTIDYAKNFSIIDPEKESNWSIGSNTENINFVYSDAKTNTKLKINDGAAHISSIDNDNHIITAKTGATADEIKSELKSFVNAGITLDISGNTLTVTAEDGITTQGYTIQYATVWDFSEYTTEVKLTADGVAEANYNGLEIALAGNGAESDHDKITTAGVYWRGGASSGESVRYIKYTPTEDGTLTVTGKLNASSGRLGISTSRDVSSLKDDGSSTTSTSAVTFQTECNSGTTYYIIAKGKSATVSKISYSSK